MSVAVIVLYSDGCPSWQTALERLHTASTPAGVAAQVSAAWWRPRTKLKTRPFPVPRPSRSNGVNPFAQPAQAQALACRVYEPRTDGPVHPPSTSS